MVNEWFSYEMKGGSATVPTPISFVFGPVPIVAGDGKTIGYKPEHAKIIAAAPDLLEAAENILDRLRGPNWNKPDTEMYIKTLEAAVARARGE